MAYIRQFLKYAFSIDRYSTYTRFYYTKYSATLHIVILHYCQI